MVPFLVPQVASTAAALIAGPLEALTCTVVVLIHPLASFTVTV